MSAHRTYLRVERKDNGFVVWAGNTETEHDLTSTDCYCQQVVCEVASKVAGIYFPEEKQAKRAARRALVHAVRPCEVCGKFGHNEERHITRA